MRWLIEPSHLDLCCLQKPIIIACASERVNQCITFLLTLKAPSKLTAEDILNFLFYFLEKIRLIISYELFAKQMIHMKCQDLFSLKIKLKKKMLSAAVVTGALKG